MVLSHLYECVHDEFDFFHALRVSKAAFLGSLDGVYALFQSIECSIA